MLVFEERGNRSTWRKPLGAEQRTNELNPHMTPDLGIEPEPHWWKASALTTVPTLHQNCYTASFVHPNAFRVPLVYEWEMQSKITFAAFKNAIKNYFCCLVL